MSLNSISIFGYIVQQVFCKKCKNCLLFYPKSDPFLAIFQHSIDHLQHSVKLFFNFEKQHKTEVKKKFCISSEIVTFKTTRKF